MEGVEGVNPFALPAQRPYRDSQSDKFLDDEGSGGSNQQDISAVAMAVEEMPTEVSVPEKESTPANSPALVNSLDEIVDKIYILESSGGKNDICQKYGKGYNGFGYGVYGDKMTCFETQAEARSHVKDWFSKKLKEYTLEEALLVYNTGKPNGQSDYVQKYNSLD